jgi:hypothetical protein
MERSTTSGTMYLTYRPPSGRCYHSRLRGAGVDSSFPSFGKHSQALQLGPRTKTNPGPWYRERWHRNRDSHRPTVGPLRESCIGYSVPQPIGCLGVAPENTLCDQSQLFSTQPGKARHARVSLSPRFSGPEFCILAQAPTNALLSRIPILTGSLVSLARAWTKS